MNRQQLEEALRSMDVTVPDLVHRRVDDTLSTLLTEHEPRKRIYFVWASMTSVCLILLILFGLGFVSPTMAQYLERFPFVGVAFKKAGDPGVQTYSDKHTIPGLNLTVTDQGIPITLDQVIYDGIRLSIGFIHPSDTFIDLKWNPNPSNPRALLAGNQVINGGGSGISKKIDKNSKVTVYHVQPERELPDSFELTIHLNEVTRGLGRQSETVTGEWKFQVPVNKISEGVIIKTFDPPLEKSQEGTTIAITQVVLTPVTSKVDFTLVESDKYEEPWDRANLPDELTTYRLSYELMDERGVQMQPLSYGGGGVTGEPQQYSALFESVTFPSNSIIFRAVEHHAKYKLLGDSHYPDENNILRINMPKTLPITIKQGNAGEITFHQIEYLEDKTLITYEVRGTDPHFQDGAWWIEDRFGNEYRFNRYDQIRLNDDPFTYQVQLPAFDPDAELQLAVMQLTDPIVMEELEFVIPIDPID